MGYFLQIAGGLGLWDLGCGGVGWGRVGQGFDWKASFSTISLGDHENSIVRGFLFGASKFFSIEESSDFLPGRHISDNPFLGVG